MFAVIRTLALWVFVWVIWSFLKRGFFFSLPSIQVHLFRSLSSVWFWENFFASPHKLLVLFFFWFSQIKTSVRSRGDNKGTAADLQLQRWSVSEDKKAAGVTRVDRDEAAGEKSLISLSQVELSLSADGGRSVVLFFLSSLKVQKVILENVWSLVAGWLITDALSFPGCQILTVFMTQFTISRAALL